jgi:hypothetical protein
MVQHMSCHTPHHTPQTTLECDKLPNYQPGNVLRLDGLASVDCIDDDDDDDDGVGGAPGKSFMASTAP